MLTVFLAAVVVWCLFAGSLPAPWPLVIGLSAGGFLAVFGRHEHNGVLMIDVLARRSRYAKISPSLKVWGCVILLILCVLAHSPWPPLMLFFIMTALTISGGIHLHDYLALFALPAVFLLLSGLALLWNFSGAPEGIANLPFFGQYLVLLPSAQVNARLVMARALGAVSCLYFMNLSTPMPELLSTLRKAHVPGIMVELAVLIYRYIFIMFSTYHSMKDAAASRLGFGGLRRSIRTTGAIYAGLLGQSFRRAGACFDAMESRCYNGEFLFLEQKKQPAPAEIAVFAALLAAMTLAVLLT